MTSTTRLRRPRSPADETGRAQQFVVDVVVRRGSQERRHSVPGRDIYAVTAPLAGEAVVRLLDGRARIRGAAAPGQTFDAIEFLTALSPEHLTFERHEPGGRDRYRNRVNPL